MSGGSDINVVLLTATLCKFSGSFNNSQFTLFSTCVSAWLLQVHSYANEASATFKISLILKPYDTDMSS